MPSHRPSRSARGEAVEFDSTPVRSDRVLAQQGDEETILLALDGGRYYTLNEVGSRIWELCDGSRTVADIVGVLCDEYDAPRTEVESDALDLLRALANDGLVAEDHDHPRT